MTFLDRDWACGQCSAPPAPWIGKAALAILQPTCYLCLGVEVSHIQVRSLGHLGRSGALFRSSKMIASLPKWTAFCHDHSFLGKW